MAEFGWAYVAGGAITGAAGPEKGILVKEGDQRISGSANFTYDQATTTVSLLGHLSSSGTVSASVYFGDGSNLSGVSATPAGSNTQIQFNNAGAFGASSNLTFASNNLVLTGSMKISGSLTVNELNVNVTNKDVVHVSATGSTTFGDSSDDIHTFTGAISGSKLNLSDIAAGTATTSSYLALDANNNVVLTSSSGAGGGSGQIGAAEDGSYTDGLYTDFTVTTPVGTAVDRFNEVLKILAPTPAPALSRKNYYNPAGLSVKLSFGASNDLSGLGNPYDSVGTAAGFEAKDINQIYSASTSGNNFRLGVYNKTQAITGTLNFNVEKSISNGHLAFSDKAFGNAEAGSLKLEVNGVVIETLDLTGDIGVGVPNSGSGTSIGGDNSGFIKLSLSASSIDGNGAEWYIFKHRTADYKIGTTEQRDGWNYARVIHSIGATDYATNYVEWVNDPSGAVNDLSVTNQRIEEISLIGSKYLSGINYNTDATAKYKVEINNLYRNVFQASGTPISFTVTNSTTPSAQSVPDITGGDNHTKVLGVTGSLDYNGTSLLSGSITANVTVSHPFKSTISNVGSATTGNGFLIDNRTLSSTNLLERFHDESQRKTSGSFDSQGDVTGPGFDWNSNTSLAAAGGHQNGMIYFDQKLQSPVNSSLPNAGNFSTLINAGSQPDYTGIAGTTRFYRKLQNSTSNPITDLKITSTKNSTTYNNSSLGTGNLHFFVKIPGVTGWMDISQNFVYGNIADGDGALISGASNDTDNGNNVHHITFGTASVAVNDYVMLRIEGDSSWTGYLSQLSFQLGASTDTASTPGALSDINMVDSGTAAKLSFGVSSSIDNYSNATGSNIAGSGMLSYNINDTYNVSDNKRGVLSAFTTMNGEINEAISADGSGDFPAKVFYNAFTGSLILEVNGSEIVSSPLNTLAGINLSNGNGSRLSASSVQFSKTTDNILDFNLPYRSGIYEIVAADQKIGWNYARLIHRVGGVSDVDTNYIEWIVDPSGSINDLTSSSPLLKNFNHTNIYYQSGVKYFASSPTSSFTFKVDNCYRNVYSNSNTAVSFPTSNQITVNSIRLSGSGVTTKTVSATNTSLASLNSTALCHEKTLQVTGNVTFNQSTSLVGVSTFVAGVSGHVVNVQGQVTHPLKNNVQTSTESKNNFLVFSASLGSTNQFTEEYFNKESFRLVSGSYNTSASINPGTWSSENSMNDPSSYPAYNDGMLVFNGFLISPVRGGNNGDFRNTQDGGTLQSPSDNVDYSSGALSSSVRTFYRYYENNTSNDRSSITITMYGSGSLVNKSTALGNNGNYYLEAKIPGNTAWLDVGKAYTSNNKDIDGSGALVGGSSPTPINTGGTSISCTFNGGTQRGTISGPDRVVLKISAHKDWIGYLSRLKVAYS